MTSVSFRALFSKGDITMPDNNLYMIPTSLDPILQERVQNILDRMGLTLSDVVTQLLYQIILHRKIPFEMKLPD
jgi:addiction module RelB/DinJ family antitoxin